MSANDLHIVKINTKIPSRRWDKAVQLEETATIYKDITKQQDMDYFYNCSGAPHTGPLVHQKLELESPDHTQRDTNESDNNISSCSTLDIGKVEHRSVQQLETQVRELYRRLQQAEEQHTAMQRQLEECTAEKEHSLRRLEVVSSSHECRITEMHCVIAELSKKLRAKQESTILEEQEPEGSEISYQDRSVYNSELNLTNPDAECQLDPMVDGADRVEDENCDRLEDNEQLLADMELPEDQLKDMHLNDNVNKGKVEALQEEVLHLRAQIALLQSELASTLQLETPFHELVADKQENDVIAEPPAYEFYGDHVEAKGSNSSLKARQHSSGVAPKSDHNDCVFNNFNLSMSTQTGLVTAHNSLAVSPQDETPVPKMAERVRLRCASKTSNVLTSDSHIVTNDLQKTELAEHLSTDLKINNNVESFMESTQRENELQRLQRKVEHLKMRNTVLGLTLDECKENCEHLYLLCGKYESNAIALQSAVNCSDRAIEAYDVMLALHESKLSLMKDPSEAAEDSRKAVESVARHLLDRLESEKSICENSLGPWQNTFNIPEKTTAPWTSADNDRLRYHVSKLKGRRSTVQNTIVNFESPFCDTHQKSRTDVESSREKQCQEDSSQLNLEMAVLMQELLNLREENINLKCRTEKVSRERQYAVERCGVLQEALQELQVQFAADSSSQLLFHHKQLALENRISYSEAEHVAITEQQLVEALARESALKSRIQMLIASVAATQKISDEKYEQLHGNINAMQKSNLSLTQMVEHNKRKYQLRIRKLEQKLADQCYMAGRQTVGGGLLSQQHSLECDDAEVPETTL